MTTNNFGQKLRSLRLQRGLSQNDLAEPGLSAGYISLLENGKRPPTSEVILRIAARLDVSPEVLSSAQEVSAQPRATDIAEPDYATQISLLQGDLAFADGDISAACDIFEAALENAVHSVADQMEAIHRLAHACEHLGELDRAVELYRQWLDLHQRQRGSGWVHKWLVCATALTRCMLELGRLDEAVTFGVESLAQARTLGVHETPPAVELASSVQYTHHCRGDDGRTDIDSGAVEEAATAFLSRDVQVAAYSEAARAAEENGDQESAHALLVEALHTKVMESRAVAADRVAVTAMAHISYQGGRIPAQLQLDVRPAVQRLQGHGTAVDAALGTAGFANILLNSGESEEAHRTATEALATMPAAYRLSRAQTVLTIGRALRDLSQYQQAQDSYESASALLIDMGLGWLGANALFELAEMLEHAGDASGALSVYRTASKTLRVPRGT
ncbi:helix-turn-helix domain-containing protein [Streptomyces sp. RGM 3693]|uniref:helix-turn-helix domain-containing protein n=1 Tax=Streptomyces sp. RGM 3693 TaxID=3413284 RepID=UPI003D2C9213